MAGLLIGRSGTGKTTLLSNHLFSEYCLNKSLLPPGQKRARPSFNQIFTTRNSVLVNCVRKSFRNMVRTCNLHVSLFLNCLNFCKSQRLLCIQCQGSPTLPQLAELDALGNDSGFPRFFDRRGFLEYIDSNLQKSYFAADEQKWHRAEGIQSLEMQMARQRLLSSRMQQQNLVQGTKEPAKLAVAEKALELIDDQLRALDVAAPSKTAAELSERASNRGKCVDFEFFRAKMWGRMQVWGPPQHGLYSNQMALITSDCDAMRFHDHQMALITSDCDALQTGNKISSSAVWTEIVSHITGSTSH